MSPEALAFAQLGAVWALGGLAMPLTFAAMILAGFAGGRSASFVVIFIGNLAVAMCLLVVITHTHSASILGSSHGQRVLWVMAVMGAGVIGWGLGWAVTDVIGLAVGRSLLLTILLGGVPFALVAGWFLRGWRFSVTALALSVALVGCGLTILRQESPEDLEARMSANGLSRETAYVVAIPGYSPINNTGYGERLGGGSFLPTDPADIPPDRYITITAHDSVTPGKQRCGQPVIRDGPLRRGSCTVEKDGLVHRHNSTEHGYQVSVDDVYVTVVGTPAVGHDRLRAAARSLHLATDDELGKTHEQNGEYYAAAIPGYEGQSTGIPASIRYSPADHSGNGAHRVAITLRVTYSGDEVCFSSTTCTPAGEGVTYLHREDEHGYMVRRAGVNVLVVGGLQVDKKLLRNAALDARPATDEELRRTLPPLEPRDYVDRLRQWLR